MLQPSSPMSRATMGPARAVEARRAVATKVVVKCILKSSKS
jgi:hypothetical protein